MAFNRESASAHLLSIFGQQETIMNAAFAIGWQILLISLGVVCQAQVTTHLNFLVSDAEGKLMPCRIHVRDSTGAAQFAVGMQEWMIPGQGLLRKFTSLGVSSVRVRRNTPAGPLGCPL